MAINIRFDNVSVANQHILKTFNSPKASKALDAYQPLSNKDRKLNKLRALQVLKQSSGAQSLNSINLNETSLSKALQNADGATLQAMLNLLSSKMIEQNRVKAAQKTKLALAKKLKEKELREKEKAEFYKKIQEIKQQNPKEQRNKQEQEKQQKHQNPLFEEVNNCINSAEEFINDLVRNIQQLRDKAMKIYSDVLDSLSLKNIYTYYEQVIQNILDFYYKQKPKTLNQDLIQKLNKLPEKIENFIECEIQDIFEKSNLKTNILNKNLKPKIGNKIIKNLNKNLTVKRIVNNRRAPHSKLLKSLHT